MLKHRGVGGESHLERRKLRKCLEDNSNYRIFAPEIVKIEDYVQI